MLALQTGHQLNELGLEEADFARPEVPDAAAELVGPVLHLLPSAIEVAEVRYGSGELRLDARGDDRHDWLTAGLRER
ncbi:MAG: hypothetical protein M3071_19440 [Actinomycetota bacterium]|nr:hypothetical protein [Actinomycetota bacterium]